MNNLSVNNKKIDTILVLDFGSQYTQLIARRVRELDVYSEILPWDIDEEKIKKLNPKGVILSGGPNSVTKSFTPRAPQIIFDLNIPILGICYGMQTLAEQMGGNVISSDKKEFGHAELDIVADSALFNNLDKKINVWMSHGDQVQDLPDDYELLALTNTAPIAAMHHKNLPIYAIQFHPEVTHTKNGITILENFIFDICHAQNDWKMDDLISSRIEEIKQKVENHKVLLGLSGGVDSSVTAVLLNKAIGKKLTCVFVDNGLLRKGESDQVMQTFKENMNLNVIKSDSQDIFMRHLENIDDPEQKRKIIGRTFIDVFDAEAIKLKDIKFLAQGTIYPDVIESSGSESNEARVIKSHHNVGGLPEEMELDLVEPLRDLFKDEVRRMGLELGIPKEMLERHPFPGPGLGVRIIGEITVEKTLILQEADNIFIEASAHGNISKRDVQKLSIQLRNTFGYKSLNKQDCFTSTRLDLPFGTKVTNIITSEVNNSAYVSYFKIGENSPRDRAMAMLIRTYVGQPYYMELRTNQQLGYIVAAGAFSRDDYSAMYCIVQSDGYPPHEVESRSIKFLSNALNDLDNLSNEELNTYKNAVRETINEKSTSISQETDRRHILAYKFNNNFSRDNETLDALNEITIEGELPTRARYAMDIAASLGRNPWEPARVRAFERATSASMEAHISSWEGLISIARESLSEDIASLQDSIHRMKGVSEPSDHMLEEAEGALERAREALADKNAPAVERALSRASSAIVRADSDHESSSMERILLED